MKQQIQQLLAEIVKNLGVDDAEIQVDFPENASHGDFTTNVAMVLSKRLKGPPREIAQKIVDRIKSYQTISSSQWIERVDIAGPGFINLSVTNSHFGSVLATVLKEKEGFGTVKKTVNRESLSVNREKSSEAGEKNTQEKISGKNGQKNVDKKGKSGDNILDTAGKVTKVASPASRGEKTFFIPDLIGDPDQKGSKIDSLRSLSRTRDENDKQKTIMVEFAHPNTHKAFHIGHLRNITTGETIVRLLESQGNRVVRANYQGDVGMHIAKALYALLELSPYKEDVDNVSGINDRVEFLGKAYAAGSKAFEDDEQAKGIIKDLNALIYASAQKYAHEVGRNPGTTDYLKLVVNHVHPLERVYALWKETRQWSLDYFDTVYKRVYTTYDRKFFESECLSGVDIAKDAVKKKILEDSDGAIIFRGEPYGLDTRVFVNSLGLPTYEAKELALAPMEATEFGKVDRIIHCVGPEQASFFKVTFKVEELLGFVDPGIQYHLAYGWVKLKHGKMSSRTGNVILGEWLIEEVKKAIIEIMHSNSLKYNDTNRSSDSDQTSRPEGEMDSRVQSMDPRVKPEDDNGKIAEALAIGAIKYAFLKVSTNQEIAFDLKESINTNGDSGPYLMYTYARAKSVLRKAADAQNSKFEIRNSKQQAKKQEHTINNVTISDFEFVSSLDIRASSFNSDERFVARLIMQFPDIVKAAADNYAPNTLCTYLFQLSQAFNAFYGKNQILVSSVIPTSEPESSAKAQGIPGQARDDTMSLRLMITAATAQVLKNGLYLLGINVLERM